MRMFVDTNVFLRFIDGEESSIGFFRSLGGGKQYVVSSVVISELVWVLRTSYKWDVSQVCDVVESFLQNGNLKFVLDGDLIKAVEMYRDKNVKYNDCLIVSAMETGDQIVSFDREFDRFENIKRAEPKDLIGK